MGLMPGGLVVGLVFLAGLVACKTGGDGKGPRDDDACLVQPQERCPDQPAQDCAIQIDDKTLQPEVRKICLLPGGQLRIGGGSEDILMRVCPSDPFDNAPAEGGLIQTNTPLKVSNTSGSGQYTYCFQRKGDPAVCACGGNGEPGELEVVKDPNPGG